MTQSPQSISLLGRIARRVKSTIREQKELTRRKELTDRNLLLPFLVDGAGRAGTTLLMAHLGRDRSCIFNRAYAFESCLLSYTVKIATNLRRTELPTSRSPLSLCLYETDELGAIQMPTEYDETNPIVSPQDLFLSMWQSISQTTSFNNPEAKFYAEKSLTWVNTFVRSLMPVVVLDLYRDPRDVFLSQVKFAQKSNLPNAFTRGDEVDHVLATCLEASQRFSNFEANKSDGMSHLIRYEDLVQDWQSVLAPLSRETGWNPSEELDTSFLESHKTSQSPMSSIYRWKNEQISSTLLRAVDMLLPDMLDQFGYERADRTLHHAELIQLGPQHIGINGPVHLTGASVSKVSPERGATVVAKEDQFEIAIDLDIQSYAARELWICLARGRGTFIRVHWRTKGEDYQPDRCVDISYRPGMHFQIIRIPLSHFGEVQNLSQVKLTLSCRAFGSYASTEIKWIKFIPDLSVT